MNAARLLLTLLALLLTAPAHAVTIDWVTVGDPGNAADDTTYGAVADAFKIGKYEVTIQQYTDCGRLDLKPSATCHGNR